MEPEELFSAFQSGVYINGFPKSGIHAVERFLRPLVKPMPKAPVWEKPWAGTFTGNSFSADWVPLENVLFRIGRLTQGSYEWKNYR